MRIFFSFLILSVVFSVNAAAQTAALVNPKNKIDDKAQAALDDARTTPVTAERIVKLKKFIAAFPRSEKTKQAAELLIVSYTEAGEISFQSGDTTAGIENFRAAAAAFKPEMPDNIFNDFVGKMPFNLFFRGERAAANDLARSLEAKVAKNPLQTLALTNFYLATENGDDAKRLAQKIAVVEPNSFAAQLSLGLAERINFRLEAASQAFARALQIDAANVSAKRNLADALRGLGQTEDALKLYRELLEVNSQDETARNGFVLALFESGQKDEANKELNAALAANPKNYKLQTDAAYWFAANGDGKKAVELGEQAVTAEPRYVWANIALARGLILENRPLDAERTLIFARQYGNFPTLDYELANAHLAAGLYDEAADDLRRSFQIKNNRLTTKLANRAAAEGENFTELLSRERRASIFQHESASPASEAQKLKELLVFVRAIENFDAEKNPNPENLLSAAQKFAAENAEQTDEMRVHRQIYAAERLLDRKISLPQIMELAQNATNGLDKSVETPNAAAAILADQLYASRRQSLAEGKILNFPPLPRETMSKIMRGRIEEIAGWTLFYQDNPQEAVIRLKRASAILPADSFWWRSSHWKLGAALEATGKPKEALDAYITSYRTDTPNELKYAAISGLYQRVYGSLDGLEKRLTVVTNAPAETIAAQKTTAAPQNKRNPLPGIIAEVLPKATPTPEIKIEPTPAPIETVAKVEPTPEIITAPETKIDTPEKQPEIVVPEKIETVPETKETQTPPVIENKTAEKLPEKIESPALTPIENKTETKIETKTEAPETAPIETIERRPRVVIRNINAENSGETGATKTPEKIKTCVLKVSQKQISILRNGGEAALLIAADDAASLENLKFTVSSESDITVTPAQDSGIENNQKLFKIASISETTKLFTVNFESVCGSQSVLVKVR